MEEKQYFEKINEYYVKDSDARESISSLNDELNNESTGLVKKVDDLDDEINNVSTGLDARVTELETDYNKLFNFTHNYHLNSSDMGAIITDGDNLETQISVRNDSNLHIVLNEDKTIGKIYGSIFVNVDSAITHLKVVATGIGIGNTSDISITGCGVRSTFTSSGINDVGELTYTLKNDDTLVIEMDTGQYTRSQHFTFLGTLLFLEDFGD